MSKIRYHKKKDGILRIESDGGCRYLTFWEQILFLMGFKP